MIAFLAALAVSAAQIRVAGDPSRVLVVVNANSADSQLIANSYRNARHVTNVLQVRCQNSATSAANETILYPKFLPQIETPLRAYLAAHPGIDFIVLTKGIPIRLQQAPIGDSGNLSVDSYIASLDYQTRADTQKIVITDTGFSGITWVNRFWNSNQRFSHARYGGYLVTRLDAYTPLKAMRLVSLAISAEKAPPQGKFLIDTVASHGLNDPSTAPFSILGPNGHVISPVPEEQYKCFDTDMVAGGNGLQSRGFNVQLDQTDAFVGGVPGLIGYCSWGSNDPNYNAAGYKSLGFVPGAIAETAVSTSARTFLPTTGGQSLIVDLIEGGVTGVKGYTDEPLLLAIASPDILFDRYTRGWTLAESFYAASRFVGWQDIIIGDPLCAPYATHAAVNTAKGKKPRKKTLQPGV